ncbi:hypothetical protein EDD22DRAFT_429480 [Suillus occidentalis]|nr:hypothetical protein EDD22DRAFT_429480 [Suillus occidentalis]
MYCVGYAGHVLYNKYESIYSVIATSKSWSILPSDWSSNCGYLWDAVFWEWSMVDVVPHQCGSFPRDLLALGLRCSVSATNPLKSVFANPLCLILVHLEAYWMFRACIRNIVSRHLCPDTGSRVLLVYAYNIWNLCIALLISACVFTLVSLRQQHGPQPAAYGHLQILTNLVDE